MGAGFQIAMRDLEIRGAGNLLGTEQSGHIAAIGYELYCQLLENAVRKIRNQPIQISMGTLYQDYEEDTLSVSQIRLPSGARDPSDPRSS